jgi:hypothetical protein
MKAQPRRGSVEVSMSVAGMPEEGESVVGVAWFSSCASFWRARAASRDSAALARASARSDWGSEGESAGVVRACGMALADSGAGWPLPKKTPGSVMRRMRMSPARVSEPPRMRSVLARRVRQRRRASEQQA